MSQDIKELKEVLALVQLITVETVKAVKKDGFQVADVIAFLQAPDFSEKLAAAVEGIEEVPAEAVDVGLLEGVELAKIAQRIVSEAVAAAKAKVA